MKKTQVRLLAGALILLSIFLTAFGFTRSSAFAASTIKILAYNGNTGTTTNTITPLFQIANTGTMAINLADLKIRYYYTEDGSQSQNFWCDWSSAGSANVTGNFVSMSSPATGADHYLEIGFTSGAGSLAVGATLVVQSRFAKTDWSNYSQSNDYSFQPTASTYTATNNVTGYLASALVWGTAPGGSSTGTPTPTPTGTPGTPTPTHTPTTTPTPTPTATPTPTPTPTPTSTPTPTPTPSPGTACTKAIFCDSFENQTGTVPSGLWQVSYLNCQGTGTVSVDRTVAHTGTTSMRVNGGDGYCNHVFFGLQNPFANVGPDVHVRFFVRHTTALPTGHVTFVAMRDTNDGGNDLRMGGQNGALQWNRSSDDATLPDQSPVGVSLSMPLPTNQWSCVEFEVNQAQGTMSTWLNGTEVQGLHLDNVPTPDLDNQWINSRPNWRPALADLRLGWESYSGGSDTLWFDDVAIGSTQIGCTA